METYTITRKQLEHIIKGFTEYSTRGISKESAEAFRKFTLETTLKYLSESSQEGKQA